MDCRDGLMVDFRGENQFSALAAGFWWDTSEGKYDNHTDQVILGVGLESICFSGFEKVPQPCSHVTFLFLSPSRICSILSRRRSHGHQESLSPCAAAARLAH